MWGCWQCGDSLPSIGSVIDRGSSSIYNVLSRTSGIRPPAHKRSRLALSLSERKEISRGLASDISLRTIALRLIRSPSTISREIQRNEGIERYRASHADQVAWDRARRPKVCKLARNRILQQTVSRKLTLHWSPQQIAGWLKRTYAKNERKHVSHETIYCSLFIQTRGVLKKELMQHLRTQRTLRRSRIASLKK